MYDETPEETTEEKPTTKILMKRFQVTLERSKEVELTLWAVDKVAAKKAFTDLDFYEFKGIFDGVEADHEITVFEIKNKETKMEDGLITPQGKWEDQAKTWTVDKEEFEPTDDPMLALPEDARLNLQAEQNGAIPLPGFVTLHEALGLKVESK